MDDLRPDERVERADFAPARVGGRGPRRLGPLVAGAWVVALMAVVGVGIVSHAGPPPEPSSVPRHLPVAVRPLPSTLSQRPGPSDSHAPTRPSDGKPIELEVAPGPAGIAVSGTIRARAVASVLISVEHDDGSRASWRSLSILDGGLRALSSPTFTVQFDLGGRLPGQLVWVEVTAFNVLGRTVGSVRQPVGAGQDRIRIQSSRLR